MSLVEARKCCISRYLYLPLFAKPYYAYLPSLPSSIPDVSAELSGYLDWTIRCVLILVSLLAAVSCHVLRVVWCPHQKQGYTP